MEIVEEGQSHLQKWNKFEQIFKEEKGDLISVLPDCLLIEILSRLPYSKDAVNTRKLSKRWEHVWTGVPNLKFERDYHNYNRSTYVAPLSCFFSSVNMALSQRGQSKINKFELSTPYEAEYEDQINKWIRYAVSCNVEDLSLTFFHGEYFSLEPSFVFRQSFYVNLCITDLTLAGCLLNPFGDISWENLKSLYIKDGKLNEDLMENILSGSPLLETLKLEYCFGYGRLDITSKSVKNLVISGYSFLAYNDHELDDDYVDTLEIRAPYILSLKIEEELILSKILLQNVSSLVKVDLDYGKQRDEDLDPLDHYWDQEEMLKGLILSLPHVNEVNIGFHCVRALLRLEAKGFNRPSNLKVFADDTFYLYSDEEEDE